MREPQIPPNERDTISRFSMLKFISSRAMNIALRTAHIATMGILLGGHAFDIPAERLLPMLYACIGTGLLLALSESGFQWLWFHQLRGLLTLSKLCLMLCIPLFWKERLPFLLAIVIIASVGSHMSARFRYYSVLYRKMIRNGCGPGVSRSEEKITE